MLAPDNTQTHTIARSDRQMCNRCETGSVPHTRSLASCFRGLETEYFYGVRIS